ncbi:hypothetical protein KUCAC02_019027 [Chaenocephalus aceratus]|uniref:Uncharacterized protein n=1 Tax=Chaenocephalus aceratus TaxID=36190 RepID=A0ACB9WBU1_CHAAC|nr:hypothetical protein KUCAC02_019027 [Chaenocephalus aceratus]
MELRKVQGRAAEAPKGAAGGKKCWSPGVVEDISEASEMEEAVLEEGPVGDMVFGNPKDKQRGRGTRRKECGDEKKTSAENAGRSARRKVDKEMEIRRASSTEGELEKENGLSRIRRERAIILCGASIICLQETHKGKTQI